ncbi:hypothetical protein HPB51_006196 [Rhipicephalus microplus]|uniref:Uncharacterized protein n=1 Tax=Rhipicephalus microplus TaxID=6941 RepID=A0A9J6D4A3_RHIMP|nr:hypothetical protein HPB51_006196 [Rhipicephalus microplus]
MNAEGVFHVQGKMLALGSYWQLQRAGIDFVSLLEENLTVPDSRRSSFDELAEETCAPVGSETLDAASPGAFFESNLSLAGSYDDSHSDIYQVGNIALKIKKVR